MRACLRGANPSLHILRIHAAVSTEHGTKPVGHPEVALPAHRVHGPAPFPPCHLTLHTESMACPRVIVGPNLGSLVPRTLDVKRPSLNPTVLHKDTLHGGGGTPRCSLRLKAPAKSICHVQVGDVPWVWEIPGHSCCGYPSAPPLSP